MTKPIFASDYGTEPAGAAARVDGAWAQTGVEGVWA
jgi:hypothetical protein